MRFKSFWICLILKIILVQLHVQISISNYSVMLILAIISGVKWWLIFVKTSQISKKTWSWQKQSWPGLCVFLHCLSQPMPNESLNPTSFDTALIIMLPVQASDTCICIKQTPTSNSCYTAAMSPTHLAMSRATNSPKSLPLCNFRPRIRWHWETGGCRPDFGPSPQWRPNRPLL